MDENDRTAYFKNYYIDIAIDFDIKSSFKYYINAVTGWEEIKTSGASEIKSTTYAIAPDEESGTYAFYEIAPSPDISFSYSVVLLTEESPNVGTLHVVSEQN
jgi:hypothetical protein